ncbi:MAG: hypothetical protein ACJ79A_17120 [Gemmatimonadaceae bacterium]
MIAALKQYGTNVARNTVKRQLIRFAVLGTLVAVGFVYKLVTGTSITSSDEPASAPPPAHAALPAREGAPITSPAQAAPITTGGIDLNAPKRAAQRAVDATNASIAAQTGQSVAPVTTTAKAAPPVSGPGSTPSGALPAPSGSLPSVTPAANAASVTREVYDYTAVGRRDPFFSLILTDDLRPLLGDLRLVGILYQNTGRAVAVMRDVQTNAQYRVANGGTLGRMRVTQIRQRAVLFTIDEFGLSRQDSLVWSDSTKVRF